MADYSDAVRAMRRLVGSATATPRWVLDKTWDLNPSRSKRLTVGLCLDRKLTICVAVENSGALGVKLTREELIELLHPRLRDIVFDHLQAPTSSGTSMTRGEVEFQCMVLRNGEPGLRLNKGESFVILGDVTCKALYYAAGHILHYVELLRLVQIESPKWLMRGLETLKSEAERLGLGYLDKEKDVWPVLVSVGDAYSSQIPSTDVMTIETEFFKDMLFRHKEPMARMYIDYVRRD